MERLFTYVDTNVVTLLKVLLGQSTFSPLSGKINKYIAKIGKSILARYTYLGRTVIKR